MDDVIHLTPMPTRGYMASLNGRLVEVSSRKREVADHLAAVEAEEAALAAEIAHHVETFRELVRGVRAVRAGMDLAATKPWSE